MLKGSHAGTMSQFLTTSFSRISPGVAQRICEAAKVRTRANPHRIGRQEADALYAAIQNTKIPAPASNCISPIGEGLILKGLHHQLPGEFFCAATRPPAVYRGNPFVIEVGLAYGGASPTQKVTLEALAELLQESDARSLKQFLLTTFDGIGAAGVEKILTQAKLGTRQTPAKLKEEDIAQLHAAMKNVNLTEGQTMQVLRYANRVPLQFQPAKTRASGRRTAGGLPAVSGRSCHCRGSDQRLRRSIKKATVWPAGRYRKPEDRCGGYETG